MKKSKTCFFEKISTIKLQTKSYLCSNQKHMGGKNILAAATLSAAALGATSTAIAENTETKIQQEAITCETKLACQKLTESIQAQIDEINAQSDLSKDDKRLRYNLRKQLIAVENQKQEKQQEVITTEKSETEQNEKLLATNKSETQDQNNLIEAINKTDAQIAGLRGALLEN